MAARRARRVEHDEAHENHERWLITYADMITLLMVLFIVLFAIGQTDLKKYEKLKAGLADGFGSKTTAVVDGGDGVLDGATRSGPAVEAAALAALHREEEQRDASARERAALDDVRAELVSHLAGVGLADAVRFRVEARGLVVTVVTDEVLFDLGSAALRAEGRGVLDGLADALAGVPNRLAVEGHTDDHPVRGGPYASNWELSTARATAVLRYLVETHHLAPARLSAAGYADQRPLVTNDSEPNRSLNRRVEIVVLSDHPKDA